MASISASPSFTGIPPECRLRIFEQYFQDEENWGRLEIYFSKSENNSEPALAKVVKASGLVPSLFLVSKKIAAEARSKFACRMLIAELDPQHMRLLLGAEYNVLEMIPEPVQKSIRTMRLLQTMPKSYLLTAASPIFQYSNLKTIEVQVQKRVRLGKIQKLAGYNLNCDPVQVLNQDASQHVMKALTTNEVIEKEFEFFVPHLSNRTELRFLMEVSIKIPWNKTVESDCDTCYLVSVVTINKKLLLIIL